MSTVNVDVTERHTVETVVRMDWEMLSHVLVAAALREATGRRYEAHIPQGVDIKIDLKRTERGSPSYMIDEWTAVVRLSEDKMAQPERSMGTPG